MSAKVVRIILSHTGYVNQRVWMKQALLPRTPTPRLFEQCETAARFPCPSGRAKPKACLRIELGEQYRRDLVDELIDAHFPRPRELLQPLTLFLRHADDQGAHLSLLNSWAGPIVASTYVRW